MIDAKEKANAFQKRNKSVDIISIAPSEQNVT